MVEAGRDRLSAIIEVNEIYIGGKKAGKVASVPGYNIRGGQALA